MNGSESRSSWVASPKTGRILLVAILAVAVVVRVAGLGRVPPPFFRDEAEKGYNAYCLLKTGRDYEGRRLPLFINVFGTHTSAIYQYASVPWIGLFGLEVWSVRLTAALVGIATVWFLYLLARALFDPATALVAAAILAISPWHVCFSRWAQQGIFMPLLFTVAAWGAVRFRQGWRIGLPMAAAAVGLAAYAYDVGRVLAPLFLFLLILTAKQELRRHARWAAVSALLLILLLAPTVWFVTTQPEAAMARFRRISVAQPGRTPAQIVARFLVNYAAHFNPVYLAFRGDRELRHSPAWSGEIHPLELPFLLVGVFILARRRSLAAAIVLGWIAISPVASSMTEVGIPHALRSLAGAPAFALATAVGFVEIIRDLTERVSRRLVTGLLLATELVLAAAFLYRYSVAYPNESAAAWQAGFEQALAFCNQDTDAAVYVSEQAGGLLLPPEIISPVEILVAFFERIPPSQFQASRLQQTRFRVLPWASDLSFLRKEYLLTPNLAKRDQKWYANRTYIIGEIAGRIPDGFDEQIHVDIPGRIRVYSVYPTLQ